ncbi:MAG: hypothetical protein RL199_2276, partial [Pseudomonadota bacterium]
MNHSEKWTGRVHHHGRRSLRYRTNGAPLPKFGRIGTALVAVALAACGGTSGAGRDGFDSAADLTQTQDALLAAGASSTNVVVAQWTNGQALKDAGSTVAFAVTVKRPAGLTGTRKYCLGWTTVATTPLTAKVGDGWACASPLVEGTLPATGAATVPLALPVGSVSSQMSFFAMYSDAVTTATLKVARNDAADKARSAVDYTAPRLSGAVFEPAEGGIVLRLKPAFDVPPVGMPGMAPSGVAGYKVVANVAGATAATPALPAANCSDGAKLSCTSGRGRLSCGGLVNGRVYALRLCVNDNAGNIASATDIVSPSVALPPDVEAPRLALV